MSVKSKTVAIVNTKAPFAKTIAKEALDVALIYGSYEQETSLFFQGDGVYQLISGQQPEIINVKNFLKTFSAFEFYDLEKVYICQQSLADRNIKADFHIGNVNVITTHEFSRLLHQHDVLLTF
ncbi:sulfurtransferase complex subunit TusC [Thalassotalea piscium]|uniref:tRNA 2-thiouridine synthesizing protein C n=1 Tax=Thalassotalea piscium TaxID=1230533 RepID=A0A7X0NFG8_9GAMM|nr:sulfurtransferase complex subunit TusC [Thalassotalea piscium]MBB6542316.1 tRNA 2-thiouridine synthesizing protein C [Thalassotalea piscium]